MTGVETMDPLSASRDSVKYDPKADTGTVVPVLIDNGSESGKVIIIEPPFKKKSTGEYEKKN